MAFKGDLKNISLFDVFQTLNQNKQVGVLVLQRDGATKKVYIAPEGVRVFFTRSFRPLRLGEIFVRRGVLTPQDIEILLLEQKRKYRPIGQILVESGKVSQDQIDHVLRYHAEDEIFEIFSWETGSFAFFDGQDASDPSTPLSEVLMDPASLCLEAARRLDEMERLREFIPSDSGFYCRVDETPPADEASPATIELWELLAVPMSVNEARDLVGLSLYDTLRGLHELLRNGSVRALTVSELLDVATHSHESGDNERAAQLLELAHQYEPTDLHILEDCIEAIQRLGEPRRLAKLLGELGRMHLHEGRTDDAIEYLEQALRNDSGNLEALSALQAAFAEQGDVERAAETALKVARALADSGEIERAVVACEEGIDLAPGAVALRYYACQLYMRTDRIEEASEQLCALIEETETSRKLMRSEKAQELLTSCYRLLLKIDPDDEAAQAGLRAVERRSAGGTKRRNTLVRGGIAAAVIALLAVVGLSISGTSAEELFAKIEAAASGNDEARVQTLISDLLEQYPDSAEAGRAVELRRALQARAAKATNAARSRQEKLRAEIQQQLDEVRTALGDRPYLEALSLVQPFVQRVARPDVSFLRREMQDHVEYMLEEFFDRVIAKYKEDRQLIAGAGNQLNQYKATKSIDELQGLEDRLARVRQRDWSALIPEMDERLVAIVKATGSKKVEEKFASLRKQIDGAGKRFEGVDDLYYAVKRERIRTAIVDLEARAKKEGRALLRTCEFEKARAVYKKAFDMADGVKDLEPRKHFHDLLTWLEARRSIAILRAEIDKIDLVVETLMEIEERRGKKQSAIAFRLLRDLVSEYKLIEFERKYRMPYAIESTPRGADVYVNETVVGKTPCSIEMHIFKRAKVKLHLDGFHNVEQTLDPKDKKLSGRMSVALQKRVEWNEEVTGNVEARPVLTDKLLLLATSRANLLAFNLENGTVEWDAKTGLLDRITAQPVVVGDIVYLVTVGGRLARVRLADGKFIGTSLALSGRVEYDPVAVGKTLYLATRKPSLVAVRNGKVLYEKQLAHSPSTNVVALNNRLFIGTADKGTILVHDRLSGHELARMQAPSGTSFFGGLATHGHLVLAGAEDGYLYAFDSTQGALVWKYNTQAPVSSPALSDGTGIYVARRDGRLQILNAAGEGLVRYEQIAGTLGGRPVLRDRFIYALAGGRILVFDLRSESPWWDKTFNGESPRHIVANDDVTIVVTSRPWVYAFPADTR
ncbi:MAG: PQQ-binding-like beta-propeller repeat protein [Planctomycetota bacterium]|nr:PQQ-binding-like beta-propeller repeat protein [Planctomycetota bacterium]